MPVLDSGSRLASLKRSSLLDSPAEAVFDRLVGLASEVLQAPMALLTLVDADRQFFKSAVGLPEVWAARRESPLTHSFCQYAVAARTPFLVEVAAENEQVRDNLAIRDFGVCSYMGVPIFCWDGEALGTLCVMDSRPRAWTDREQRVLTELAASVMLELRFREILKESELEHARALAAERQRALEELALGLRHEINNALAGLLLSVDQVNADLPEDGSAIHLRVVQSQAFRIRDIVHRLERIETLRTRAFPGQPVMIDLSEPAAPPGS